MHVIKNAPGFITIDKLADENGVEISKKFGKSLIYTGTLYNKNVVLAKPQTYMNLSGEAVVELTNFYKPEKTLIIYDDIDLPFGTIRYRENGSAGTHNGMRNIVALTGTTDIPRLRIGIKPESVIYNLADYVTGKIPKDYLELMERWVALTKSERKQAQSISKENIEGKNVIILEDIVDTGNTLKFLKGYISDMKPKSLKIVALLDKKERREVEIDADYVGFEIDDLFVIGYGLDYNQKYRNLPYIGVVVK